VQIETWRFTVASKERGEEIQLGRDTTRDHDRDKSAEAIVDSRYQTGEVEGGPLCDTGLGVQGVLLLYQTFDKTPSARTAGNRCIYLFAAVAPAQLSTCS
jgi:hypothetical protein